MNSRLAIFCDKLLEAGWLAALVVAPLYFNVYSSRVFEPDKAALVRSLALVMLAAWVVRQFENGLPDAASLRAALRRQPLYLPTLAVASVYMLATLLSLVPGVSLWGSYQRMQGAYTTLSYIVIFFVTTTTLRTRAQFDRAINTLIVTSFPIAFYGLLQHYRLDPLPWGGDTVLRVASNLGNSIFVAAYLIMVAPLTLARLLAPTAAPDGRKGGRVLYLAAGGVLTALWTFDFSIGTSAALALLPLAIILARVTKSDPRGAILRATYTLVLAAQFAAILFTQSRGPFLGLAGGLFVFAILYARVRGARKFVLGAAGVALGGAIFLGVFNLPASPLDPLRQLPYVGRLGQIFETAAGTGRVRELIWQGALQIVSPHAPLWSPTTGDDALNLVRPLVGYGLEAMYVAFNPFYPPELAQLEARNASPDRAHNESFDALVMTGGIGFAASILLFGSVFYFALKWLGLLADARERRWFIALWLAGGLVAALGFGAWRGWHYVGVALPAGMMLGFFVFLVVGAGRTHARAEMDPVRALWLIALISAISAHFIEIHFGIAIVATRLYFWFLAALLAVASLNHVGEPAPAPVIEAKPERAPETTRRRKRVPRPSPPPRQAPENNALAPVLAWTALTTLILLTLTYEFVNNQTGATSALEAVRQSLFFKANGETSGVFLLFALTWLVAGVIGLSGFMANAARAFSVVLFIALTFTAMVWAMLLQERALTQTGDLTNAFAGLLAQYYFGLCLVVAVLAASLFFAAPRVTATLTRFAGSVVIALLGGGLAALTIYSTNFASIAADIYYKSGSNYDSQGAWEQSIDAYRRARELQPAQDFYALFLGRAYLEKARALTDAAQRAAYLKLSEQTLLDAQKLNPLNTDHTANLARLNRLWAGMVNDTSEKNARYQKSSDYYQHATRLSPNTAYLRNEWAQTLYQSGDLEKMRAALEDSLKIDAQFAQTYLLLGEYYRARGDAPAAVEHYLKAITLDPNTLAEFDGTPLPGPIGLLAQPAYAARAIETYRAVTRVYTRSLTSYWALAELSRRAGELEQSRAALEQAVQVAPDDYFAHLQLVNFFSEQGQIDAAVTEMRRVLDLLPPSRNADYPRFQQFYNQLQTLQRAIQTAQKTPNDLAARRTLAAMWKARGQPAFALAEYQAVARLLPNDYDAHKNSALLNLQLLKIDDAERALVTAIALAPVNDKPFWQNVQMALNDYKTKQFGNAAKSAQAALALALDADKPVVQAFVQKLTEQVADSR